MSMSASYVHNMYHVHALHAWVSERPEGVVSHGTTVRNGCEPPYGCQQLNQAFHKSC